MLRGIAADFTTQRTRQNNETTGAEENTTRAKIEHIRRYKRAVGKAAQDHPTHNTQHCGHADANVHYPEPRDTNRHSEQMHAKGASARPCGVLVLLPQGPAQGAPHVLTLPHQLLRRGT